MALKNPWVGYLTRSYEQIKASLLATLRVKAPEVTDFSPSNILIVILDMFAGVAEMLSLYIDNMAREAFIATARRYTSMIRLVRLLDYRVKAATGASADLTITFNTPATGNFLVPLGAAFRTENGIPFVTTDSYPFLAGVDVISIPVKQVTNIPSTSLGNTDGSANQAFALPNGYVHDSISIVINFVTYVLVQSLGRSTPTDEHYIVEVDADGVAKVIFGDGINGIIPPAGLAVIATYQQTLGPDGNVAANTINTHVSGLVVPGVSNFVIANLNPASGGSTYETVDRLRISGPLSIRTLDRAVTEQDYIDITKLAPGVAKAAIDFDCGKTIDIYIVPLGGGIASTLLLDETKIWVDKRRTITTFTRLVAAGPAVVRLRLDLAPRFLADPVQTEADVRAALANHFSTTNQDINKKVRLSDIYALVDNLTRVDFLTISHISLNSYAQPQGILTQLNWIRETLNGSVDTIKWRLEYTELVGVPYIRIFRQTTYMGMVLVGTEWVDPTNIVKFTVNFGAYTIGEQWVFYTYPVNKDIEIDDYSIPVYDDAYTEITIIKQLTEPI